MPMEAFGGRSVFVQQVYQSKEKCCGCGVCISICPKKAIKADADRLGFIYPMIDQNKCIDCGICRKSCPYNNDQDLHFKKCFAAMNHDILEMMKSSSGGCFPAIAGSFIRQNGVVCGASMTIEQGQAKIEHILINSYDDLVKLQGSKYVQSSILHCLPDIENALHEGKKVLFSGTPCQVAAVKGLFKQYHGSQLFTIDLICHGVPSADFFNAYLTMLQKKHRTEIAEFIFRNKQNGWGHTGTATNLSGAKKAINPNKSSYYKFFLDGEINRESCYSCPYARKERAGDITIGDYWGVAKYDPQIMEENGGPFSRRKGISCLLINSDSGDRLIQTYGEKLIVEPIDINNVMKQNTRLTRPIVHSDLRNKIFRLYTKKGYSSVERMFQLYIRIKNTKRKIKHILKIVNVNFQKN